MRACASDNHRLLGVKTIRERFLYRPWHETAHVATEARDLLDEPRTNESVRILGHHENRFHALVQFSVHQGELKFKFEVGNSAQSAHHGIAVHSFHILDEQSSEGV